jgi:hypothetical protein
MISKEILREECLRLFGCETLNDSFELMDVYIELLFRIIHKHHEEPVYTKANADAKMLVQMIMTKALTLRNVVNGISYQAKDGASLNRIVDPTIVACLIRNLFETVAMFNLIYRNTKTQDEKTILYSLWVHAGLQYRQRFESVITTAENQQKYDDEKKALEQLVTIIEGTELYKQLDENNQNKIKTRLKQKEYLMRFNDKEVVFLHWQELTNTMQIRPGLFDKIYTYFSLYSHPSNVSVFQFADMFKKGDEEFPRITNSNLKYFFALTSIFIADYIKLFPTVQTTFDNMDIRDQIVINYHNTLFRGHDFSINDSSKAVD